MNPFFARAVGAGLLALTAAAGAREREPSFDGPPLSLQQATRLVLERHPQQRGFAFRQQANEARAAQAALRPAPELSLDIENLLGSGSSRGLSGAETTLAVSQVLELGGKRAARLDAAAAERERVDIDRRIAQLDLVAETTRRFIHVASDQEQLRLTQLATDLAARTATEVERRVEAAKSPEVERRRARIAQVRAEVEQEHAEHELLTSRRKLALLWGEREPAFGAVSAELYRMPSLETFESLRAALDAGPDRQRYLSDARLRDADVRLAQAKARADIGLMAGLRWLGLTDDNALVAGLRVPLFAASRAAPLVAEAQAQRAAVDTTAEAAQLEADAQLYEWYQELRHAITEAETLRDRVLPETEAALEATEYAYQRGRYGYLEWVDAQRERIEVQRALIESAREAHVYRAEIERLTAQPLAAASP